MTTQSNKNIYLYMFVLTSICILSYKFSISNACNHYLHFFYMNLPSILVEVSKKVCKSHVEKLDYSIIHAHVPYCWPNLHNSIGLITKYLINYDVLTSIASHYPIIHNVVISSSRKFTITVLYSMLAYPKHLLIKAFGVAGNVAIKNLNVDKR